jgi:hypothetical protein
MGSSRVPALERLEALVVALGFEVVPVLVHVPFVPTVRPYKGLCTLCVPVIIV